MKAAFIVAITAALGGPALAGGYPTVRELESGLGYSAGQQLPKDVPARGRGYHVFYMRAQALRNGEYNVRIRLR